MLLRAVRMLVVWIYEGTDAETNISILVSSLSRCFTLRHSWQLILSQISHISYRTRLDRRDTKL